MKIIFATGNKNKLREIRAILAGLDIEVVSMKEAGFDMDIVEDGQTFAENALIKARTVCKASGEVTLADDSGLVVDALGGEPGIYSARWMGEDTPYSIKNAAMIERLNGVPDEERSARFVCSIACVYPDGTEDVTEATYEGRIGYEAKGQNGFGYDPIFYVPEKGMYSAELSPEEKNAISHRGKALRAMRVKIEERLKEKA